MTGSNPSITTTRLANYGFKHFDNQAHTTNVTMTQRGSRETRNQGLSGKNACPKLEFLNSSQILFFEYYPRNLFALIQQSTKLNCITNSAIQQL